MKNQGIYDSIKGVLNESAEQINELSKKTLGNYVKKAASSMASSAQDAALADEWGENGEEADAHAEKRHKGIKKAVDKLVKEDEEQPEEIELPEGVFSEAEIKQLDELSTSTLKSYRNKAGYSHEDAVDRASEADFTGNTKKEAQQNNIIRKREAGLKMSQKKLNIEEVEQIEEARERTDAFRFTHKPGDPASEKKLADVKAAAKKAGEIVKVRGRLGKDSPHAHLYKPGGPLHKSSSQDIKKEHSAHFDVYAHKDWRKLRDEEEKQNGAIREKHRKDLTNHYKNEAHRILKKHGYELVNSTDTHHIYTNNDLKTNSHHTATVAHGGYHPSTKIIAHNGHGTDHMSTVHLSKDHHDEEKKRMPVNLEHALLHHHQYNSHTPNAKMYNHFGESADVYHDAFGYGTILEETETNLQVMFDHGIEDLELNK